MLRFKLTILLLLLLFSPIAYAQTGNDETTSSVPELGLMHAPIYKLWHTAWPKKDIRMLKNIYPQIKRDFQKLDSAKLPGILRDKKKIWDEKLEVLRNSIIMYQSAIQTNDSALILIAAERVHTNYEIMVSIIRPVMSEIETFHQSLYLLHHYYIVDYNVGKIKESADSLSTKMALMEKAELPERLMKSKNAFEKARSELSRTVVDFVAVVKSPGSKSEIIDCEQRMHQKYEQLEKVFQ